MPENPNAYVSVKVRKDALRLAKTAAGWRETSVADFLSELILRETTNVMAEIAKQFPPDKAPTRRVTPEISVDRHPFPVELT